MYTFLPPNPDESANKIREIIKKNFRVDVGVIISDTFNRPWRIGSINVALGFSGFDPLLNLIGEKKNKFYLFDINKKVKEYIRNLLTENRLTVNDLIWPVFICDGENKKEEVSSMPNVYRYSIDNLNENVLIHI